ncbi:TonB-dependent receptor [Gluconacetobacter azotocaptans]|uniref:TonB-dependent receptor n=1 Tax=Gluconacetobacter azotocaptans TaxID=142834 RepID=A0A7W4PG20_9PROT|nr:TonB-dependent receptor [Gluconacetobacter azotocaptans]MBB2189511.1 TonB-dependent receptor [Gluconacetobacter azotocaptans]GBQ32580.1 TonB-dependent receptor [Gluconacetobacter azotocaptans DSM 13594]
MHGFHKVPRGLGITPRTLARVSVMLGILADAGPALAATPTPPAETAVAPRRVESILVTGQSSKPAADIRRFSLPQTVESTDRRRIEATTNIVDAEDALKYMPSLFVRKRNNGDTQATLQTRTWGVNSSARSLVYVDDMPISALISNNNTNGAPRWGMVAPEQIERVDMLYGPFAAEYPGNAMGGVVLITTRMPDRFAATVKQTGSVQSFDAYKTHGTYGTAGSAVTLGDKIGRFSWFVSANREETLAEPLFFITSGQTPAGTTGIIPALSKTGATANVVGAGGLLHSTMNTVTGRVSYDLTDWLRASYTIGFWTNDARARSQTYLTDAADRPTFGGVSGFANDTYTQSQRHLMNAVSLKTDTRAHWDWEAIFTDYAFLRDMQRNPAGVLAGTTFRPNGYLARLDGTGWTTADVKAIWRPDGSAGPHEVSFGGHRDQYDLNNPTYNTDNWMASPRDGNGTLYASGRGRSSTYALWAQDAWTFAPGFTLTVGGRLEFWRAFDGANFAGTTAVAQPRVRSTNASPKATLAWRIDPAWSAKLSFGEAYRYPTVAELYQIVATGGTYSVPDPDLSPENVYSGELTVEHRLRQGRIRLSLFQENVRNALISQSNLINNIYTTTFQNVRQVRNRGVEFVVDRHDLLVPGLDVSNSVTYVDSRILSDPGFSSAAGTTATGKHVPYVPNWRDTAQVTYRPNDRLDLSVAVRYQGRMYSTLDNTDRVSHVFGAFDPFVVVDLHAHYRVYRSLTLDAGIDNVNNDRYYEYHPFPMRTYVADLKARF